jgi:putative ABC transport system ATP-binding protein
VDRAWLDTLTSAFGIADRLDHLPSQLSGGQIQRVAISRALVTSPAVVFADEPTGNLDSRTTDEVLDFLRLSVDEFGQTVVMVTHERDAAERADRILTLADGRIHADEDLRALRTPAAARDGQEQR